MPVIETMSLTAKPVPVWSKNSSSEIGSSGAGSLLYTPNDDPVKSSSVSAIATSLIASTLAAGVGSDAGTDALNGAIPSVGGATDCLGASDFLGLLATIDGRDTSVGIADLTAFAVPGTFGVNVEPSASAPGPDRGVMAVPNAILGELGVDGGSATLLALFGVVGAALAAECGVAGLGGVDGAAESVLGGFT